jgi:site-specific DNA-cytosine methylase
MGEDTGASVPDQALVASDQAASRLAPAGFDPSRGLVLSLFPGIGLLDMAFEEQGFCVVRGPDPLWGGDVRAFHVPAGRFDGIIGGPPCQPFSQLVHMVRANGYEPKHENLIPEYERIVSEAQPSWFVMEEVRAAPLPIVPGYAVHEQMVNARHVGSTQNRERRISFGTRDGRKLHLETECFEPLNALPHPRATRLQNFVATLRLHGNEPDNLNLETLARFNPWTSADELLVEFRLQQNGTRKLPEEVAAQAPPGVPVTEEEE